MRNALAYVLGNHAKHAGPGTSYQQCQMSIPYTVACALLDGGVGENSFTPERIASHDVRARHSLRGTVPPKALAPPLQAERCWLKER